MTNTPSIILTPNGQHSPNGYHTFPELLDIWIGFLEAEEKSERTIETYRWTAGQFISFLEAEGWVVGDTSSIKAYLCNPDD